MKLPRGDLAEVDSRKVREYLLSETHPIGRSKARFFRGAGFDEANGDVLVAALLYIARTHEVIETSVTVHGVKYALAGNVESPTGRQIRVRTIWIVDRGYDRPRFVTAYPA